MLGSSQNLLRATRCLLMCLAMGTGPGLRAEGGATATATAIEVPSAILSASSAVDAPAPESGILERLGVREGALVRAGENLGEIEGSEQRLALAQAEGDLALALREAESDVRVRLADKEHQLAKVELQRAVSVNNDIPNTVSAKEVDRLRLAVDRTALEIEHAGLERSLLALKVKRTQADVALARMRIARLAIVAPAPGIVAELHLHAGEWADKGELVARIVRVDRLRAEGFLNVRDALLGLVGRSVRVTAELGGGRKSEATGRIAFVSPEADPVNSQVRFWAEIENPGLVLRPGLSATISILPAEAAAGAAPVAAAARGL